MAEYVSVYNATRHAMLLRNLIAGLKIIKSISRLLKIYCDNSAAVSFSNSNSSTGASLYLDTKYLFVRERVDEQHISIKHIRTHKMLADLLTKGIASFDQQLKVHKFEELEEATDGFSLQNRLSASVYRGTLKGKTVVIKEMGANAPKEEGKWFNWVLSLFRASVMDAKDSNTEGGYCFGGVE
uniref:Putative zinc finger, CCHC-type n=1 Tax=Tanacetum cinerariifolium TaxID=118510 RepID=A0A6L2P4U1_TANCI|nr:putative zinc finger, CCHC-type [Tanacetum cinerariifolium]